MGVKSGGSKVSSTLNDKHRLWLEPYFLGVKLGLSLHPYSKGLQTSRSIESKLGMTKFVQYV